MDAVQIIKNETLTYLQGNSIYDTYRDQWQYLFESFIGGEEYRNANHLVRYQLESDGEYQARLKTTPLQNHCASVISVYNSFLFRQPPQRTFGNVENVPELMNFLYDADLDGRSFNGFMKDVSTYASIFGHSWVIVAKPNIGAVTRADELAQGVRPYVSLLSPLNVLDWNWSRNAIGKYELDYLKYVEEINGNIVTVKEWTKETIETVVVDKSKNIFNSRTVENNGLSKIPAVIAYNKRSVIRGIGISDIADIADAQKFIYNATSEIDQSIRLDSHPSLVKTHETEAGIGAGSLIHMPDNLDPGLKPYIIEFNGASVDKILASINHTITSIDKMANTGAVRATESRTMSGVAMETEFSLLNARLSEKGDALELAEEQIWELFAEYQGTVWDGIIEYPDSFNIRDTKNDLDLLLTAQTAGVQSIEFNKEIQKEIAKLIIDKDSDSLNEILAEINDQSDGSFDMSAFETHTMINPATGESRTVSTEQEHYDLMAQGWVNAE